MNADKSSKRKHFGGKRMTLRYIASAGAIFISSAISCNATLSTYARSRLRRVIALITSILGSCAVFGIGALAPTASLARPPHPRIEVGTRCQQEYQNGWQQDVGNSDVWRRCGNFNSRLTGGIGIMAAELVSFAIGPYPFMVLIALISGDNDDRANAR